MRAIHQDRAWGSGHLTFAQRGSPDCRLTLPDLAIRQEQAWGRGHLAPTQRGSPDPRPALPELAIRLERVRCELRASRQERGWGSSPLALAQWESPNLRFTLLAPAQRGSPDPRPELQELTIRQEREGHRLTLPDLAIRQERA